MLVNLLNLCYNIKRLSSKRTNGDIRRLKFSSSLVKLRFLVLCTRVSSNDLILGHYYYLIRFNEYSNRLNEPCYFITNWELVERVLFVKTCILKFFFLYHSEPNGISLYNNCVHPCRLIYM